MANRYWVGGTATWDATVGTKWALTSGGAGGQAVPTSSDDVYFDSASGAVTVTCSGSQNCSKLDTTGFTGTLANSGSGITVRGNLILDTTITYSGTAYLQFTNTSGSYTITTNGKTIGGQVIFASSATGVPGYTYTLQDNFTTTQAFSLNGGILQLNNKNLTCGTLTIGNAYDTRGSEFHMGSGTIAVSGDVLVNQNNLCYIYCDTSTLTCTGNFTGANRTFYNVTLTGDNKTISGSNTFNILTLNIAGLTTGTVFTVYSTQYLNGFATNGYASNLARIRSSISGSPSFISMSTGVVQEDYMSLADFQAVGGGLFFAGNNSINNGNNNGWIFSNYFSTTKSETISLTEGINKVKAKFVTLSETLTLVEGIINKTLRVLSETLNLTGNIIKLTGKFFSDTIILLGDKAKVIVNIIKGGSITLAGNIKKFLNWVEFVNIWIDKLKPSTLWSNKNKPATSYTTKIKPSTTWTKK